MAAPPGSKEPLDVLQLMINDVLVQTGKALRASRKDESGNLMHAQGSVQLRLPETLRTFHSALDDLESEIIRAKSVMERDLARLQANKASAQAPQPVEAQTKSPMVIDLDSSPPATKDMMKIEPGLESKPVAPIPDMGIDLSGSLKFDMDAAGVLQEPQNHQPQPPADIKAESDGFSAPTAPMTADENQSALQSADGSAQDTAADFTFTNMEFTLAPNQGEGNANQDSFDLSSFTQNGTVEQPLSLDNLLPQNDAGQNNDTSALAQGAPTDAQMGTEIKDDMGGDGLDLLSYELGDADGTDFDFGLDGNSFNELMTSHEDTFDTTMEHGHYDDEFFGLDKTEGA